MGQKHNHSWSNRKATPYGFDDEAVMFYKNCFVCGTTYILGTVYWEDLVNG